MIYIYKITSGSVKLTVKSPEDVAVDKSCSCSPATYLVKLYPHGQLMNHLHANHTLYKCKGSSSTIRLNNDCTPAASVKVFVLF